MYTYEVRFPDGEKIKVQADGISFTEEYVTLYAKQDDGAGGVVFFAHTQVGVTVRREA